MVDIFQFIKLTESLKGDPFKGILNPLIDDSLTPEELQRIIGLYGGENYQDGLSELRNQFELFPQTLCETDLAPFTPESAKEM